MPPRGVVATWNYLIFKDFVAKRCFFNWHLSEIAVREIPSIGEK